MNGVADLSDSQGLPGKERRSGRRFTLVLRAGKLICDAGEFLCVLRDVSERGLRARLFHPLPECAAYEVECGSGARFPLEPVWSRGGDMGFRFAAGAIDIRALLAEQGPFPKRSIRLRLGEALPVRLSGDDGARLARLDDISQHGARIQVPGGLALGEKVRLEAEGLPVLHARVRWRRGKQCGLVFQEGFRLDDLAALVARLQCRTALPAMAGTEAAAVHVVNQ